MTGAATSRPTVSLRATLPAQLDERALAYGVIAGVAFVAGLVQGGTHVMVIGVPFVVALLAGTVDRHPTPVAVEVVVDAERCLEGDTVSGRIDVAAPDGFAIELIVHRRTDAVEPDEDEGGPWGWWIAADQARPVGVPLSIRAVRWGRWSPGVIEIRLVDPGSMVTRRLRLGSLPELTVLPAPERTRQLLRLDRVPAVVGAHPTRADRADGYEFAEVREYHPGDRVRDLNWTATARTGSLAVNQRLPERAGTLVIVVDTFPDALRRHTQLAQDVIVSCGRIAWSTARRHLADNDRVGIVVAASRTTWMTPQSGRRAPYVLFDALLGLTSSTLDTGRATVVSERVTLPPGAAVLVISPLERPKTVGMAEAARSRGHRVEIVAVDLDPAARTRLPDLPEQALRLRALDFSTRVTDLRRRGIPTRVVDVQLRDDVGGGRRR